MDRSSAGDAVAAVGCHNDAADCDVGAGAHGHSPCSGATAAAHVLKIFASLCLDARKHR